MPIVEDGKCSAVAVEKDFWRERIRSAFCESKGCCWVLLVFCEWLEGGRKVRGEEAYL